MTASSKLITLTLASAVLGIAQSSQPLVANKIRRMFAIGADGTLTLTKEEFGTYARSVEGTATHFSVVSNGSTRPAASIIQSAKDGRAYVINHINKTYKISSWDASLQSFASLPASSSESQVINGVRCVAIPIKDQETQTVIGKSWVSPELGVMVKSDATALFHGKPVMRITEELTNIQVNVTPDSRAFIVPAGF